jgi:hypothetical protein
MAGDLEHIIPGGSRGLIEEKHQAAGETPDQDPEDSHGLCLLCRRYPEAGSGKVKPSLVPPFLAGFVPDDS